jgi:hypothetical protein
MLWPTVTTNDSLTIFPDKSIAMHLTVVLPVLNMKFGVLSHFTGIGLSKASVAIMLNAT